MLSSEEKKITKKVSTLFSGLILRQSLNVVVLLNFSYFILTGNYGCTGMKEFRSMAANYSICEAETVEVPNNAEVATFDMVVV
jgi:hypothetical protein